MMQPMTKWLLAIAIPTITAAGGPLVPPLAQAADFEDVGASLPATPPGGAWNGSDKSGILVPGGGEWGEDIWVGGFSSGGLAFNNVYTAFDAWEGWAYSNTVDISTAGFLNQYSAMTGGGAAASETYAVAYNPAPGVATINIPSDRRLVSADFVNTTYAYLAIRDGDDGVPPEFGGPLVAEFTTGDHFLLQISGYDEGGLIDTVPFYLADYSDYTPGDNDDDFIVTEWTTVDLAPLAEATQLQFALSSTDVGDFGVNTPTYFAIDNIVTAAVPEPSTLALLLVAGSAALLWRRRR